MDVIYQDNRIFVCIKPAGILSTDEPGGMPQHIRQWLGDAQACVRTVHRLDQVTSGVMVFARSRAAASILSQQIREERFEKEYLAVINGTPQEKSGEFFDLLWRDKQTKMTRVVQSPGKDVQPAMLFYEVLGTCQNLSLVKILLKTGRTHQIRVQFASRQMPLVGEKKYALSDGHDCDLALWSYQLRFFHPQTEHPLCFCQAPPLHFPWDLFEKQIKV